MAPSRRDTRSRTSSPYSGRPDRSSRTSSQSRDSPATPKARQAQQEPSSRHRYGLRSMLSNLIWGSPVKAVEEEESEDGQDDNEDDGEDDDATAPGDTQRGNVQVISDDEDEQEEVQQPDSAATSSQSSAPRRFTPAEKGKGSPKRTDSYSATKSLPQQPAFGGGLRSSQTFGDMRSVQRDVGSEEHMPTSTPNTSTTPQEEGQSSPRDVNSQLASFFAAKGSASLTADERKRISEILLGGNPSTASSKSNSDVPTALTPNFSFNVPVPSTLKTNVSILSPAYKGLARSSTTSGGLSSLASRATGGLAGSQSMSSLASLANGTASAAAASANPRSALNRRQARPLYLGAGYSSQAIARRQRVQAQMSSLYSNLSTFDSTTPSAAGSSGISTPGKRRRVGEEAATSSSVATGTGTPARSAYDLGDAPPAFSVESPVPLTSTPGPSRAIQQPSLFQSAPHLKAQFGATPARPSPLRQAAAVATPSPPAKTTDSSPPRTMSKTAGLMRGIIGDTAPTPKQGKPSTPASSSGTVQNAHPSITMTRSSKPTTRVPREELIKRAEPPSAAEILERSMPPELRATPNGRQTRPKPPPVPASARKTRAALAAEAEAEKEDRKKAKEQTKENSLRVPSSRKSKSRSKTPDSAETSTASNSKQDESTTTKMTAGQRTTEGSKDTQVEDSDAPKKSAFSFGSGVPPTPAPSFFGNTASKTNAPAVVEVSAPSPLFAFNPPSQAPAPQVAPSQKTPAAAEKSSKATDPYASTSRQSSMDVDQAPARSPAPSSRDPKEEVLQMPSVSLPTFSLYDTQLTRLQASSNDDAGIKAIKQTVLEIPTNELVTFNLL